MKNILLVILLLLGFCASCKMPRYVPVETIKMEYRDNYIRDSIVRYDSIFVGQRADTIVFERYRYLYKDRIMRDSIFINDTIRVPYPLEVVREVAAPLTWWHVFQLWCGRILLIAVALLWFLKPLTRKVSSLY